jgi:hypothetical protein
MSLQPDRPMLMALREMLRRLECRVESRASGTDLKGILERRIARMEDAQRRSTNFSDR